MYQTHRIPIGCRTTPRLFPWLQNTACPDFAHSTAGSLRPPTWISRDGLHSIMASSHPFSPSRSLCQCISPYPRDSTAQTQQPRRSSLPGTTPSTVADFAYLVNLNYLGHLRDSPVATPCLDRFHLADRLHYIRQPNYLGRLLDPQPQRLASTTSTLRTASATSWRSRPRFQLR